MKNLGEVFLHISTLPAPVPFIAVSVEYWETVRDECREWCYDNDHKFSSDKVMTTPNFLVAGIPIIQAGHA